MDSVGEATRIPFSNSRGMTSANETPEPPCLADCVRFAVRRYLADRGDHPPNDLHQFVLAEIEKPLLTEALAWSDGNQSRCAELLGLSRGTLRKKLKTYDLI